MLEYQQAWQIPAPQNLQLLTLKPVETFADMMTEAKCFYSMCLKEKHLQTMLGLRYFTMMCNDAEYKNMDQDEGLGQLYDVQIQMKIFYKQSGWAYSFSIT
jgi:hypothetical protein